MASRPFKEFSRNDAFRPGANPWANRPGYIAGRYEGASTVDAAHIFCGSFRCSFCRYKRSALSTRGYGLPARINSLRRLDETGAWRKEVDLEDLPQMQHHPTDWALESVDDVCFLRWRPAAWVASDLLRGHAASNLLREIIMERQLKHAASLRLLEMLHH